MAVAAPLPRPIRRASAVAGIVAVALLLAGCLTPGQDSVLRELNADRRAYNRSNLPTHAQAQAKAQVQGTLATTPVSPPVPSSYT